MSNPVYFLCYESVYKMSSRKAQQFITACLTGVGCTYATSYGKRVRRKVYGEELESGYANLDIADWCARCGYHFFHFTDFEREDWQQALALLQTTEV